MKAVVSDTSPISYLVRIGQIDLLPAIFGHVFVPPAVLMELRHLGGPPELSQWIQLAHGWLHESRPQKLIAGLNLDAGETEAISLAKEIGDALLIIDEIKGRTAAAGQGILITGTLGILEEADRRGLVDLEAALQKLRATNFRMGEKLFGQMLERSRERRAKS